jgi:ferredoxin
MRSPAGTAKWIKSVITRFVEKSPDNNLENATIDKAFDSPLIGFSAGSDPIYIDFKTYVGAFHWTPAEVFALAFPGLAVEPEELTVVSWVLPQTESTRRSNRKESLYPSESWARARIFGEKFNEKLRKHVVETLTENGLETVAPVLCGKWERKASERFVFASTWSERHAAYASGLGTFGLCYGLITARGKAMRLGSVVVPTRVPASIRPYRDHHEYCLFFTKGVCGKCIERCPVHAVSKNGHDKIRCFQHLKPTTAEFVKSHYHFDGYG